MKTLMATDGSQEATTALRTASRLLRKTRNEVEVLCVAPPLGRPAVQGKGTRAKGSQTRERYSRRITRETKAILDEAAKILGTEGVNANFFSEIGSPADVIVKLAEDHDVTVIGAASRNHPAWAGLGSVASRVVEHAEGTVLVARELSAGDRVRVLVGLDGSLASKHALSAMAAYFDIDSAEVTLMHVKETPWIHLGLDREWFDSPGDVFDQANPEIQLEEELQREAEDLLEDAQARLAKYNYSVLTQIEDGNPATEILGEAESGGYDLIVLGAADSMDTKHNMVGSVSARVAWQAPCSVAVVKSSG
ncbi:MAG TPA: universal stress protein [Blastocatellia bacterium]|nr:universal stress protein [Blastocatellia bacterium]